jgi:ATP-dependent Clp protease ATP-binding subunit ClpC
MFERFTESARRIVVLAQEEARLLEHRSIGTEHLLLGLISLREQAGDPPLVGVGIDVARDVTQRLSPAQAPASSHIPFTTRAKKALEEALREATAAHVSFIAPGHILLGILDDTENLACRVLADMDVDLDDVRRRALASVQAEVKAGSGERSPAVDMVPRLAILEQQVTRLTAQVAKLQHRLDER